MSHIKEQIGIIRKGISLARAPEGSFIHGPEQIAAFRQFLDGIKENYLQDVITQNYFKDAFRRFENTIETREKEHREVLKNAGIVRIKYAHAIRMKDFEGVFNGFGFSGRSLIYASQENLKWVKEELNGNGYVFSDGEKLGDKDLVGYKIYPNVDMLKRVVSHFVKGSDYTFLSNSIADSKVDILVDDMKKIARFGMQERNDMYQWHREPREREIASDVLKFVEEKTKYNNTIHLEDIEENVSAFKVARYIGQNIGLAYIPGDNGIGYIKEETEGIFITGRYITLKTLLTFDQAHKLCEEVKQGIKDISEAYSQKAGNLEVDDSGEIHSQKPGHIKKIPGEGGRGH